MYRFINETLRAFLASTHLRAPRFCRLTVRFPGSWGRAVWRCQRRAPLFPPEQFSQTVQHRLEDRCLTWPNVSKLSRLNREQLARMRRPRNNPCADTPPSSLSRPGFVLQSIHRPSSFWLLCRSSSFLAIRAPLHVLRLGPHPTFSLGDARDLRVSRSIRSHRRRLAPNTPKRS